MVKHAEATAERRKKKSKEGGSNPENPGLDDEPVDPFLKLAGKIRFVRDRLHVSIAYTRGMIGFPPENDTNDGC
jgi:hypothetical protein